MNKHKIKFRTVLRCQIVVALSLFGCDAGTGPVDSGSEDIVEDIQSPCESGSFWCVGNKTCVLDDDGHPFCDCLPPYAWFDDFEVPDNLIKGQIYRLDFSRICELPMPAEFFDDLPEDWKSEGIHVSPGGTGWIEGVVLNYDTSDGLVYFHYVYDYGFAVRADGVGIGVLPDNQGVVANRLELTRSRARFLGFNTGTGEFNGEWALVPIGAGTE